MRDRDCLAGSRPRSREATTQALIAAAKTVFARRGYDAATTREVAETAGVNEQLIQRYFSGKAGLLVAILDLLVKTGPGLEALPLAGSLNDEIAGIIRFSLDRAGVADLLRVGVYRAIVDPAVAERMRTMRSHRRAAIGLRLRAHMDAETLPNLEALTVAVESLTHGWAVTEQVLFQAPRAEFDRLIAPVTELLVRGAQSCSGPVSKT